MPINIRIDPSYPGKYKALFRDFILKNTFDESEFNDESVYPHIFEEQAYHIVFEYPFKLNHKAPNAEEKEPRIYVLKEQRDGQSQSDVRESKKTLKFTEEGEIHEKRKSKISKIVTKEEFENIKNQPVFQAIRCNSPSGKVSNTVLQNKLGDIDLLDSILILQEDSYANTPQKTLTAFELSIRIIKSLIKFKKNNDKPNHCDIKPENFILGYDGNIWLIDFDALVATGEPPIGTHTLDYVPPEFFSLTSVTKNYDNFSLGMVLKLLWGGFQYSLAEIVKSRLDYYHGCNLEAHYELMKQRKAFIHLLQEIDTTKKANEKDIKYLKTCIEEIDKNIKVDSDTINQIINKIQYEVSEILDDASINNVRNYFNEIKKSIRNFTENIANPYQFDQHKEIINNIQNSLDNMYEDIKNKEKYIKANNAYLKSFLDMKIILDRLIICSDIFQSKIPNNLSNALKLLQGDSEDNIDEALKILSDFNHEILTASFRVRMKDYILFHSFDRQFNDDAAKGQGIKNDIRNIIDGLLDSIPEERMSLEDALEAFKNLQERFLNYHPDFDNNIPIHNHVNTCINDLFGEYLHEELQLVHNWYELKDPNKDTSSETDETVDADSSVIGSEFIGTISTYSVMSDDESIEDGGSEIEVKKDEEPEPEENIFLNQTFFFSPDPNVTSQSLNNNDNQSSPDNKDKKKKKPSPRKIVTSAIGWGVTKLSPRRKQKKETNTDSDNEMTNSKRNR